jgi:hypothetical protein
LAHEIEAEVNLYIRHLFLLDTDNELNAIPLLDYVADGFDQPGVMVLFGGDHGDKHCPISCKINLSSPTVQKEKRQLSYQCPVVVFASVECSTDAYSLMDSTVMPMVKQQLICWWQTKRMHQPMSWKSMVLDFVTLIHIADNHSNMALSNGVG